jgi:hypothetical protein
LGKAIASLELAGVLSQDERARPAWCGGDTVVVQLGDVLDRGDNEIGKGGFGRGREGGRGGKERATFFKDFPS